ncbi:MAG: biosynthetic-type acetolactate synthase large subunit [Elusimicrobiota bacterium]
MKKDSPSHMHLIACLVEDRPGVLARISGMFSSRGFNIDSLAVGGTQIPGGSRISLVCRGDDRVVKQIVGQLNKLVDVIRVADLSWDDCVESELMLVKVSCPAGDRGALEQVCRAFHARVNDQGQAGFIIEAAGRGEETDSLIKALQSFGMVEMSRSGRIVIQRGKSLDSAEDLAFTEPGEAKPAAPGAAGAGPETMTGADMIPRVLAQEGVDTIFGYSGGAILPTIDAFFRYNEKQPDEKKIKFIVPANEQGATFMAAGYARSSGKVGAVLVTSGPGATNTVTPVRDAMADSVPLVVITGQVPRPAIGSDAFQEAPVFSIMSACAKHVFLVEKPEELEATLRTAFEIARTGRPGPVVVDVCKDVQIWQGPFRGSGVLPLRGYRRRVQALAKSRLPEDQAKAFFHRLSEAQRPLIYAGGGVINAGAAAELKAFAETFQIPVVTTLLGIGGLDNAHPLSLHMLGMHGTAYANYAVEDCDFLFAAGSRFDDRVAGKAAEFAPKAKFIAHLDIDAAEIGKVKAPHWHHVSDARRGLRDLLEAGKALGFRKDFSAWVKHVQETRRAHPLGYKKDGDLIQPQFVLEQLAEITKGEAILTTGVGQHQMWAAQYGRHAHPRRFLTSGSMGTMGYGLPAAVGAQFANPGRTVIDVDGDGSLRMNFGEMETITTYGLPVKVLLLNNEGDGMVRQWQTMYFGRRFFAIDKNLHSMNFVKAAEAMGFPWARRLTKPAEVRETLEAFVGSGGPAFLDVAIDPFAFVYPMVGPGMGYKDMVTGDWIPARISNGAVKPADQDAPVPDLF